MPFVSDTFLVRDRRSMKVMNLELARLLGTKLSRIGEPTVADLSPRQREVLICLMESDSAPDPRLSCHRSLVPNGRPPSSAKLESPLGGWERRIE